MKKTTTSHSAASGRNDYKVFGTVRDEKSMGSDSIDEMDSIGIERKQDRSDFRFT
ncbi:MAG TPA: hypothetical protein VK138_05940 [Acidiferrobacterales bacterium]|nr:hypothetical protein [Acidiferrobacterales bacterium]